MLEPANIDVLPDPAPWIDGAHVGKTRGEVYLHRYAATGKPTVEVPMAGAEDVADAIAAARRAAPAWRAVSPDERRRLLLALADLVQRHAAEFSALQIVENGVPRVAADAYPGMVADMLQYNAGWAEKNTGEVHPTWPAPALDYTQPEPYGVVAIIIPWNSPLFSVGSIAAPALAAGNCVVIKPPEITPFSALRFAELALTAGFPPGVLNIVPGGAEAGEALVTSPDVDKIHFTGSGRTAERILRSASANLAPVSLELGGKSPNVVFPDVDIGAAAQSAVFLAMINTGQGCINGTRALVHEDIFDRFVASARRAAQATPTGDPALASTTLGPVIDSGACRRIVEIIERAKADAPDTLLCGGSRMNGSFSDGYFIEPTIFSGVRNDSEIAQIEVFGPVLSIVRFSDEEQATALANDTKYGLAAYVQTSDVTRAHRMANALDAGMVWINGFGGLPPSMPFGGFRQSGIGKLGGRAGVLEFTRQKNVWIAL